MGMMSMLRPAQPTPAVPSMEREWSIHIERIHAPTPLFRELYTGLIALSRRVEDRLNAPGSDAGGSSVPSSPQSTIAQPAIRTPKPAPPVQHFVINRDGPSTWHCQRWECKHFQHPSVIQRDICRRDTIFVLWSTTFYHALQWAEYGSRGQTLRNLKPAPIR